MTRRRKLLWLLFLLILAAVVTGLVGALRKGTSELPVYTKAASRMLDGERIYRPNEDKPFTYPPFFAVPFMPIARFPSELARGVWYLVNVAVLFGILVLLSRALRPQLRSARRRQRGPPGWVFWLVVALVSARHVAAVFSNQSHDLLVFGALVLCLMAGVRSELRSGAWAGVGAACKATPLLFAPVFFWQRRFLACFACVATAALLVLLPDLITPQNATETATSGKLWIVSWYETFVAKIEVGQAAEAEGAWARWNILNQNLSGTIWRLSREPGLESRAHFDVSLWNPSTEVLKWVTYGAQAFVLGLVLFATRPSLTRNLPRHELTFRRLGEVGLIACAMLLLSPMSSKSHFCVLMIPIAFCVADLFYRRTDVVLMVLLVLVALTGTLSSKGIWGSKIGNQILARGSVTLCTLLLLLATAHVLFHRRKHGLLKS